MLKRLEGVRPRKPRVDRRPQQEVGEKCGSIMDGAQAALRMKNSRAEAITCSMSSAFTSR